LLSVSAILPIIGISQLASDNNWHQLIFDAGQLSAETDNHLPY